MECPLINNIREINLIKELQRLYGELRAERDERRRLNKLIDELIVENKHYKKLWQEHRSRMDEGC